MDLSGRVVVVTGAGGALAGSVNSRLHAAGAELLLVDRPGAAEAAAQRVPGSRALALDLTDPASAEALRAQAGGAYALIHTVGTFSAQPAHQASTRELRRLFAVNFDTLFHATTALLPGMLARGEGVILGISAGQALRGEGPGAALYTASKAAVAAFLRSVDAECSGGVSAAVLYPVGTLDTPANRSAMPDADPAGWIDPEEVAASALHLLTRGPRGRLREISVYPAKP
jgi:NAD(P)-dependent dehydrogenase (short-subunit alcohol dehydrogenase family)